MTHVLDGVDAGCQNVGHPRTAQHVGGHVASQSVRLVDHEPKIVHDPAPPPESYLPVSGGLFVDFLIHDFDAVRWLGGSEVEEVYAVGSVRSFLPAATYDGFDTAVATLRLADGSLAALTAARQNPLGYDIRTEINGSLDSIVIGLDQRTPVRSVEPGGPQRLGSYWSYFPDRFEHAFKAAMSSFVQLARGEIASVCTARDSMEALRVAAAATVSAREHRPVSLTEMPALDTVA